MTPCEQLNPTEIIVARLVFQCHTNREIARMIHTSEQMVKNHLRAVFNKLGVWNRLELAIYVARHGGESWHAEKGG